MTASNIRPARRAILLAALLSILALATPASAQRFRGPDKEQTKGGEAVKEAFRDAVGPAGRGTVIVLCDGKESALGTVVAADGWIVTKASELSGTIACLTGRGQTEMPARLVGVSEPHDLAMLKVEAKNLTPVAWGEARKAEVGQFVASAFASDMPVAVGVLSVGRRKIPGRSGMPGVLLADADGDGAKVAQVYPDSPAAKAGVQVDDVITAVNGHDVNSREELVATVRKYQPGQSVEVALKRGDKSMDIRATLAGAVGPGSRADMMNQMGGPLSSRNANFPAVIQHDTVLLPNQCGGPLVTLDGKAIGVNIARAGRVESFALPADVVQGLLGDLKSGKLAPPSTRPVKDDAKQERKSEGAE